MAQAPSTYGHNRGLSTLFLVPAPQHHQQRCNRGQKRSHSITNKGMQQRAKEVVTAVPFSNAGSAAVL